MWSARACTCSLPRLLFLLYQDACSRLVSSYVPTAFEGISFIASTEL
jgi:hypothetical protein